MAQSLLLRRTGASYWRRRANRQPHRKRWRNFAVRTGDLFTVSSGDKGLDQRKQRTSLRVFLRCCWSAAIWRVSARKGADFVLTCWSRSNIFLLTSGAVPWQRSEARENGWFG